MTDNPGPNKRAGETGANWRGNTGRAFNDERKAEYLDQLRAFGREVHAQRVVGVSRDTVARHKREDEQFRDAVEEALQQFRAGLVVAGIKRGRDGYLKPVFHQGRRALDYHPDDMELPPEDRRMVPAAVREFSDGLLIKMLQAHLPEFKEKLALDANIQGTVAAGLLEELRGLSRESRDQLAEIIEREEGQEDGAA